MSRVFFNGFVCDEDSQHLAESFGPYKVYVASLAKIGITPGRGTPDAAILRHARESGRIIVTGNRSDFQREMQLAAKNCSPARCYEGGGMITVANGLEKFPFQFITRTLQFNGYKITWGDVFTCNLHVAVHRDCTFNVYRSDLCEFFHRDHADCSRCRLLGIASSH